MVSLRALCSSALFVGSIGVAGAANGLTVTINDVVLTPPPGSNFIDLQGNFGTPQPGLLDGLRIVPSSPGATPIAFVVDTPTLKGIGLTDFAALAPRPAGLVYPFNTHRIRVEHEFGQFTQGNVAFARLGMSGSYTNLGNPFAIGGEVRARGAVAGNQINGTGTNNNFATPRFIPGVSELIYHPADDIRLRPNPAQHSCDNIIGQPPTFSCSVSEFVFLGTGPTFEIAAELDLTFVDQDRFNFPGSLEVTTVIPVPPAILSLAGALALLAAFGAAQRGRLADAVA